MKRVIVPFFIAHQGCPHRCIFCNQGRISGGEEKLPTGDEILEKIGLYLQSAGARSLEAAFFGGTFTSLPRPDQEALLLPLRPLLNRGELSSVRVSTRPDAIDRETARFLKAMGVKTVELGIQSMNDEVLARAGRGHTSYDSEKACRLLKEAGFRVGAQLMPGLPGDTPEKALETVREILALDPDFLRIYPTLVIAGTGLESMYRKGEYLPLSLDQAVYIGKLMLLEALKSGVPVIRMGLQSTDELRPGDAVVAGPYHAAFRQLVEGELFSDLMLLLTTGLPDKGPVTIYSSPLKISEVAGQRRTNLLRLRRKRGMAVTVKGEHSLSSLELQIIAGNMERRGSLLNLNYSEEDFRHDC